MRTNIEIDDALIAEAMASGEFKTKRAAVEAGLTLLVRLSRQGRVKALRGALSWDGDLDAMRRDA